LTALNSQIQEFHTEPYRVVAGKWEIQIFYHIVDFEYSALLLAHMGCGLVDTVLVRNIIANVVHRYHLAIRSGL
jgi:hypothetical protein